MIIKKLPFLTLLWINPIFPQITEIKDSTEVTSLVDLVVCDNNTHVVTAHQYSHDACPKGVKPIMFIENFGLAKVKEENIYPEYLLNTAKINDKKSDLLEKLTSTCVCENGAKIYYHKLFNVLDSAVSCQTYCEVATNLSASVKLDNLKFKTPPVYQNYENILRMSNALNEVMNKYPGSFGLDISHHQGEIQWSSLRQVEYPRPISFVIMKATEGGDYKDKKFKSNWALAKLYNFTRGAYHFYRPDSDPHQQARNYIEQLGTLEAGDFIPVIDIEKACRSCSDLMGPHFEFMQDLKLFVQLIKDHYKSKVLIYSGNTYYYNYIKGYFPDDYFWLARYSPDYKPYDLGNQTIGWQFSDEGKIEGISTRVDLNYFLTSYYESLKVK